VKTCERDRVIDFEQRSRVYRVFFLERGKGPGAFQKGKYRGVLLKKRGKQCMFTFHSHITMPSPSSSCP